VNHRGSPHQDNKEDHHCIKKIDIQMKGNPATQDENYYAHEEKGSNSARMRVPTNVLSQNMRNRAESSDRQDENQHNPFQIFHANNGTVGTKSNLMMKKSKSNLFDKRGAQIKQNAELLLAMKICKPSLNFGQTRRQGSNSLSNHYNLASTKNEGFQLPILNKRLRSDHKKRAYSESSKTTGNVHSVINNKDDIVGSLKYNYLVGQTAHQDSQKDIPLFSRAFKPKHRSNSENRMRHLRKRNVSFKKALNGDPDL